MIGYLEKNKRFSIIFMVLIAIEIFVISSIPASDFPSSGIDFSSAYHLMIFFLLNFFIILSLTKGKNMNLKYVLISIVFSLMYAVLDEIHQFFVPTRFPSLMDLLIDATGIFLSTLTYLHYKRNH